MKAQSFFGGTHPKETGKGVRQVGHKGQVKSRTTSLPIRETVKQVKSSPVKSNIKWVDTKQVGNTGRAK